MENVEVLLVGETREWETVEYAADAVTEGKRKALIIIGHVPSEQAGMEEGARWLKTVVKKVPVEIVPTKQPFWALEQKKAHHRRTADSNPLRSDVTPQSRRISHSRLLPRSRP